MRGIADPSGGVIDTASKSARYLTRMKLGAGARTVQTLSWWRPSWRESIARPGIAACIDGFPRSANTYAYMVFRRRHGSVPLGHHMHVPGQILRAAYLEVPCAVLFRRPLDAISSMLVVDGRLPVDVALWSYVDFYRRAWTVRHAVAPCPFDEVVADGSTVARRLNAVFGTDFDDRPVDAEERDQVFADLAEYERAHPSPWLPATPQRSREKRERTAQIVSDLRRSRRLPAAEGWFERWLEFSRGDRHSALAAAGP